MGDEVADGGDASRSDEEERASLSDAEEVSGVGFTKLLWVRNNQKC